MRNFKKAMPTGRHGFTLVELMIVITVIAILATIAVVAFSRVQKQARDARRKGEMHSMVTALQGYYSEKTAYPISAASTVATTALASLGTTYLPVVPVAPVGSTGTNTGYMYISDATGTQFSLCTDLETPVASGSVMWKIGSSNMSGFETADAGCSVP